MYVDRQDLTVRSFEVGRGDAKKGEKNLRQSEGTLKIPGKGEHIQNTAPGVLGEVRYSVKRFKMRVPLVPPNPNEFESAYSTSAGRA